MISVTLKIISPAAFLSDLDGFCGAFGYQNFVALADKIAADLSAEDFKHDEVNKFLRFDFDFLRVIKPAVFSQPILVDPGEFVTHPAIFDVITGERITPEWVETVRAPVWDSTNAGQEIEPEIDRGLHLNVKISPAITPDNDSVRYAAAIEAALLVENQLQSFFSSLPTVVNAAPSPLTGGQVWHTTGNSTLISPAPLRQNRVFS